MFIKIRIAITQITSQDVVGHIFIMAAEKLGMAYDYEDNNGVHAAIIVSRWMGISGQMSFDGGPSFENVPVTVVADMDDSIIFRHQYLSIF